MAAGPHVEPDAINPHHIDGAAVVDLGGTAGHIHRDTLRHRFATDSVIGKVNHALLIDHSIRAARQNGGCALRFPSQIDHATHRILKCAVITHRHGNGAGIDDAGGFGGVGQGGLCAAPDIDKPRIGERAVSAHHCTDILIATHTHGLIDRRQINIAVIAGVAAAIEYQTDTSAM